jgi:hypothetical protein
MAVGLATISSPLPRCVELVNASGAGAIATTPKEVVQQLDLWEKDPLALEEIKKIARQWAEANLDSVTEYNNLATQFHRLLR